MSERKPFHEAIVDALGSVRPEGLWALAGLLKLVKIPANHDAILAVWETRCRELLCADALREEIRPVTESILEQKREAEERAKTAAEQKTKISLHRYTVRLEDLTTDIFWVDVERDSGVWCELLPTEESLRWFLRGVEAGSKEFIALPEIPRDAEPLPPSHRPSDV